MNIEKALKEAIENLTVNAIRRNVPSPHIEVQFQRLEEKVGKGANQETNIIKTYRLANMVTRKYVPHGVGKDQSKDYTREQIVDRLRIIGLVYLARSIIGKTGKIKSERDALVAIMGLNATVKSKTKEKLELLVSEVWIKMPEEVLTRTEASGTSNYLGSERPVDGPWLQEAV